MFQRPNVTIYTDGGCSPNPGPGGYAAILVKPHNGTLVEKIVTGAEPETTNYRMELLAVVAGLEAVTIPSVITVVCDNNNVVRGANEWLAGWVANDWCNSRNDEIAHADLWQRLHKAMDTHAVSFEKVKAHVAESNASHAEKMNNRADKLVAEARASYLQEHDDAAATDTDGDHSNERTYRLMIAGSRHATPAMREYARRVVAAAIKHGWTIVVGDNPQGIDAQVVAEVNELGYSEIIVVGIAHQPRNGGCPHGEYIQIGHTYTERDQAMARSCDRGLFIWNGQSPGTLRGSRYMKALGNKTVHVMEFAAEGRAQAIS